MCDDEGRGGGRRAREGVVPSLFLSEAQLFFFVRDWGEGGRAGGQESKGREGGGPLTSDRHGKVELF